MQLEFSLIVRIQIFVFGNVVVFAAKQYFQCSTQTLRLQFAPKSTFIASDAVHDSRYVSEMLFEFVLEFFGLLIVLEHGGFIEVGWEGFDVVQEIFDGHLRVPVG